MNYKQLETNIRRGSIDPVYLFVGPETNIADILEKEIISKSITSGMEMLNLNRYDSKDADYTEILASFETLPVMSQKRVVVIGEGAQFFNQSDEDIQNRLEKYLKDPLESTVLIIRDQKPDKRKRLYKRLKEYGQIVELEKLNFNDLKEWIRTGFSKAGIDIQRDALERFIERSHYLENDSVETLTIDQWIKQITDYVAERKVVTVDVIDEVIPPGIEENVFKIIDLAVSGKLQSVRRELENLWEHGESPIKIFALLLYNLRNMTKIKLLLDQRLPQRQIAAKTKLSGFVVKKTIPISRKYDQNRLLELMTEAAEMDYKIKTGQIEPEFALEYFILKLNVTKSVGK